MNHFWLMKRYVTNQLLTLRTIVDVKGKLQADPSILTFIGQPHWVTTFLGIIRAREFTIIINIERLHSKVGSTIWIFNT